jgi:hypothetical protein
MSYSLATDVWLSVPNTWKPNTITDSICRKFAFHHIRPVGWKVELSATSGEHANETFIIQPGQVSLIVNVVPGFFVCVTLAPATGDDAGRFLLLGEYADYHKRGKAKFWYLSAKNLFEGPYEVFNGPMPIDLG